MGKMKILLITIATIFIIIIVALGFIGNHFYNIALNPETERPFLDNNPDLNRAVPTMQVDEQETQENEMAKEWIETKHHDEVTLASFDGLKLQGYEYRQEHPTNKWAIVVHGYTSSGKQMSYAVKRFYDKGYHVLLVDLRGHGKSEGSYIGMGWHDRLDMMGWIRQIVEADPESQVALYGVSMGGATVMMTSGEELPANVKVIVEDCGYTSAYDEFTYQLKRLFHLPAFPIMTASNVVSNIRAGYDLKDASALKQVAKSKTPILFIHGDSDTFVPYEMVQELYDAAKVEKDLLVIKDAGHGGAHLAGAVYWNKVWEFTDKFMKS
ncbi:alpha/beta hydrolase [Paenibacillus sp. S-12]|uniref:alpha/beta hydrolase n=1 Tax=Paenibacillus sp. S-12 TaxID=3031371 RepID=UPI0025A16CFE|nr:alpha/beta hydrolase [Paenibacillus sp. S-12]